MRGQLFVFSGIDGGGKSTQIDRLAQTLAESHHKPLVLWTRGGYTSGINLAKSVMRRGSKHKLVPPAGFSDQRTQAFSHRHIRKIWLTLAILDLLRIYAFGIRWHLFRGRTLLCDRYWQDTLLDFQLHLPSENVETWWLWRTLVRLSPKPDAAFLLLVPLEVARQRLAHKREPFPTPDDILQLRLAAYAAEARSRETWHLLDGQRSRDEIAAEIAAVISRHGPTVSPNRPTSLGIS